MMEHGAGRVRKLLRFSVVYCDTVPVLPRVDKHARASPIRVRSE